MVAILFRDAFSLTTSALVDRSASPDACVVTRTIPENLPTPPTVSWWKRLWRGVSCWGTFLVTPLGWFCFGRLIRRMEPERLDQGLVLILTGIEGHSFLNVGAVAGMIDGGVKSAVEVVDWTTGRKFNYIYHLRAWKRNNRVAQELTRRIIDYRTNYPGRPIWLVGHSGGAGMALLIAAALPEEHPLTGVILLGAAVSREFDVRPATRRVEMPIISYHSRFDLFFVGLGTTVFGTMDGKHACAAGAFGFCGPANDEAAATGRLQQVPWQSRMLKRFNPGDHFGCMHRVFIAEEIAPLIRCTEQSFCTRDQE